MSSEPRDEARSGAVFDAGMEFFQDVGDRLAFPAVDLYVHGWDIAAAAGFAVEIPDTVIEFAHSSIGPFPEEVVRGDHGAFGPQVTPPADATPTEAFIAWTGRTPR